MVLFSLYSTITFYYDLGVKISYCNNANKNSCTQLRFGNEE